MSPDEAELIGGDVTIMIAAAHRARRQAAELGTWLDGALVWPWTVLAAIALLGAALARRRGGLMVPALLVVASGGLGAATCAAESGSAGEKARQSAVTSETARRLVRSVMMSSFRPLGPTSPPPGSDDR